MLVGLFITVVAAPAGVPTLRFYCMDFNLMPDGSVQALVKVQGEHLELFRGTDFNLKYNDDYLVPSEHADNRPYGDTATPITRDFFKIDETLYAGNDPFVSGNDARYGSVDRLASTLTLDLALDQTALVAAGGPDSVTGKVKLSPRGRNNLYVAYVDMAATEVTLGELSFWVPAEKITEMVEKYSAATPADPPLLVATTPTNGAGANAWELLYFALTSGTYKTETYHQDSGDAKAKVEYIFEFPNTLVRAELPEDFVEMNAWEAYAGGTWADVAAALQRGAGQITAGYADGTMENFVFPWGKANTSDPDAPQSDYKIYTLNSGVAWADETALKALGDDSWTRVTTSADGYDPAGGVYKVQQYFLYEEEGTSKRYPVVRTAYLVIDPVTLTGAWAKDWDKTYRASDAPTNFDDLRLPVEGTLQTAPTLGKASLTVPIRGWTPTTLPSDIANRVVGTYRFTPTYAQADLNAAAQAKYPWLTLGGAGLGSATRTIVADGGAVDPAVGAYTLAATHGTTGHSLSLEIGKQNAVDGAPLDIPDFSEVELYLPNGVKVEPTWWTSSGYTLARADADADNLFNYRLELDADLADAATQEQKDMLLRYINLGGWLSVTVDEGGTGVDPVISDRIYGYLAPRPNLHTQSYFSANATPNAFDFTGFYAGLLPLYATSVDTDGNAMVEALGETVTLPLGYGVATTYDGATGDEPGNLRVVRVDAWNVSGELDGTAAAPETGADRWKVAAGKTLKLNHGPNNFSDAALYDGYGRMSNPSPEKQVQILAEFQNPDMGSAGGETPPQRPVETLAVYENGVVTAGVVYDTKQRGYVVREERMLTLKNTGTTDASGIWLDMDYAPFGGETKGHFEVVRAPAAYLPAGGETTFVVTYVYHLDYYVGANTTASGTTYKDTISVNTAQTTSAAKFTAQFRVTKGPVSLVEVVTIPTPDPLKPGGNLMGTATVIQGLDEGLPNPPTDLTTRPNSAAGNSSYEEGYQFVWLLANPVDEYRVKEVYYYTGNNMAGVKVPLAAYLYTGTDGEGEYYYFQMPGHKVTVYVEFAEDIPAKLRMSALLVYGGVADDVTGTPAAVGSTLIDGTDPQIRLQALRRDDQDTNELLTYPAGTPGAPDAAAKLTLTPEQTSYPEFLSVLPAEVDYAQLALTLRQTLEMLGLDNATVINDPLANVEVLITAPNPDGGVFTLNHGGTADGNGSTGNPPSSHLTYAFAAPAKGEEMVITITLAYEDTTISPSARYERAFAVRLVRLSGQGVTPPLGYGNSPFGMIMNDTAVADKDLAKAAFQTGDTFAGLEPAYIPVKAVGLTNVYWSQAPDHANGVMVSTWGDTNFDYDETALFIMANQAFLDPGIRGDIKDSAGNQVDPSKVTLSISDVELLAAGAVTQVGRFSGNATTTIQISEALDVACGAGVAGNWAGSEHVRPGVYALTYTFTDYDGTDAAFQRPLIILADVGDVNADGQVTALGDTTTVLAENRDEALLENRVTDPLGYTADLWSWAELFRLRVCDGNNDRILNHIDANAIKAKTLTPYYNPVDYK